MRLRLLWTGVLALAIALPATALAGRRGKVDWSEYIDKDAGKPPPSSSRQPPSSSTKTASKARSKKKVKRGKKTRKRHLKARAKKVRGKR